MADGTDNAGQIDPLTDLAVRTVYGEGANQPPEAQQAIISTAVNRSRQSGQPLNQVLLAPNQYQAWQDSRTAPKMQALQQSDPVYQQILQNIAPVLAAQVQTPYTQYLNRATTPSGSSALQTWAAKPGTQIGAQEFYGQAPANAAVTDPASTEALLRGADAAQGNAAPTSPSGSSSPATPADTEALLRGEGPAPAVPDVNFDDGIPATSAAQAETFKQLASVGALNKDAPAGSSANPFGERPGGFIPPGAFYIAQKDGLVKQMPGASAPPTSDLGALGWGVNQGVNDVAGSINQADNFLAQNVPGYGAAEKILTGKDPAQIVAANTAARNAYNAESNGNPLAGLGRFAGQAGVTAPAIAAGGDLMAPIGAALKIAPEAGPVVNALLGGGGKALTGAAQGASGAALTSSASNAPLANQILTGAAGGAGVNVAAPMLQKLGAGAANLLTGGGVDPVTSDLANLAVNKFNIPLRAGQISNSPAANMADSVISRIPLSGYAASSAAQRSAFTRAVSNTFGADSDALTPNVMAAAKDALGSTFNDIGSRTSIPVDDELLNGLGNVYAEAAKVLPDSEIKPLSAQLDNILSTADNNGTISGESYQALTRKGSPLDRVMNSSDPNVRYYAGQMRSALDDALERNAAPEDLADLRTARGQYKNLKTVEDLAEKAPNGQISPALLLNQVRNSYGNMAYGGGGDLGDLARIGQSFLKEPPNSGTPERLAIMGLLGGGGVEGANLLLHNPVQAAQAAGVGALGIGAGRVGGMLLNNPIYRNSLLNSGAAAASSTADPAINPAVLNYLNLLNSGGGAPGIVSRNLLLQQPQPALTR